MITDLTPVGLYRRAAAALDAVPYSLIALVARAATFSVFFRSGLVKVSDWSSTVMLFADEYRVPVLPAPVAATMAASMEVGLSSLILAGLLTRLSVLGLLGMVLVIQLFVYPTAWPDHIQWLAFMGVMLCRGPGAWSLDQLLGRLFRAPAPTLVRA